MAAAHRRVPPSQSAGGAPGVVEVASEFFRRTGKDGDGQISKDELKRVVPRSNDGPSIDSVFDRVDFNGNGTITEAELAASFKGVVEEMQAKLHPTDHRGYDRAGLAVDAAAESGFSTLI